ncbi:MAG: DUF2163 domain-containing protein [Pararhodobacter sp.]
MSDRSTTLARAWALATADGAMLGFTDHDRDLAFEGINFAARSGMTARALAQSTGLAVDNTEALGALSDAGLNEADILAGRYDGATLTIWEVDWAMPASRRLLFQGTVGEIVRTDGAFRAELRGLSEPLSRGAGRVFGAICPAVLGDAACRFDLETPGFQVQVPLLALDEEGAVLDLGPLPDFAPGWFAQGRVRFLEGAAAGVAGFIRREEALPKGRRLILWQAPARSPAPGDLLRLDAGCDKRFDTCRFKFDNAMNFQGFPHIPGDDWLLAVPRGDGRDDGGSRA